MNRAVRWKGSEGEGHGGILGGKMSVRKNSIRKNPFSTGKKFSMKVVYANTRLPSPGVVQPALKAGK